MDFRSAAAFVMPFGQYKGKTLDEIAQTDKGLLYLDWLLGERDKKENDEPKMVDHALVAYLSDETIQHDLEKLLRE